MSYGPPQGGYPPYGAPPPQGYQQPPPQQYPPQGYPQQGQGYPPQQGYGGPPPPQQGHGQQGGYPPPQGQPPGQYQGYPPPQQPPYGQPSHSPYPQQQQGYPPPQQQQGYPPPQQQPYGAPPQGAPPHGAPPHGQYPPQQQYGAPPPNQPYGQPPPQQYGAPPQAPYGAPPGQHYGAPQTAPTPPSPGYVPGQIAPVDMSSQADACRKAMKGMGTDEAALIRVLSHISPLEIPALKQAYQSRHHRILDADVEKETGGYFELCLLSILRGPLQQDVWSLNKALKGAGTNEDLLNEILIGRSNADMRAIKETYQRTYRRSLEQDVKDDLSMKTERMFLMVLSASRQEDSAPITPQAIDADVSEIHRATEAKVGADALQICSILSNRSDGQIRAIAQAYEHRYRRSLEKVIQADFSGHMEDALVQMVRCGADRAMCDAINLEHAMAGAGTKDEMLINRVVRVHWNPQHAANVKGAYKVRYGRDLISKIKSETSGDYEKALVGMLQ